MPRLAWFGFLLLLGCSGQEERGAQLAAAFDNGLASLGGATRPAAPLAAGPVAPAPPFPPSAPASPPAAALHRVATSGAAPGPTPGAAGGLLGAGPDALRRWLGEPMLRRREGPAEVWLYAGPACALDLVLYDAPGGLRVAHAAARANGTAPRTETQCLRDLTPTGRAREGTLPLAGAEGGPAGA